ncbi:hypothetical protein ILUMI_08564 [Ignelater luminosus]|uniref:Uncharacterized protein n=1 Tax=Ignelater luminosus TaxID=2038154 RepID=A0A8K0GDA2_IGNLU|nr:hypothetical protein ILUMI_08564 [Ignelater luminosus]
MNEKQQELRKKDENESRRPSPDLVLVKTHALSNADEGTTAKFFPRRDGLYYILKKISPVFYQIASPNNPLSPLVKSLRKRERTPKRALLYGSGTDSCNFASPRGGDCNTSTIIRLTRRGRRVRTPTFCE